MRECLCVSFCGIRSGMRVAMDSLKSGSFINTGASFAVFIYVRSADGPPALDRLPASLFLA